MFSYVDSQLLQHQVHIYNGSSSLQSPESTGPFTISLTTSFELLSHHALLSWHYFPAKPDYILHLLSLKSAKSMLLSSPQVMFSFPYEIVDVL